METKTKEIVKVVEGKVQNAVKEVESLKIKTDADFAQAATLLTNVKKLGKFLKQEKDKILNPLKEAVNATREMFAPMDSQISYAEASLKTAMGIYQDKKDAENKKKADAIASRVESGNIKEETGIKKLEELGEVDKSVHTGIGSVNFKKIKKVRITDPNLVPDKYWFIDEVLIRKEALAGIEIAGVEVYEETSVATRV